MSLIKSEVYTDSTGQRWIKQSTGSIDSTTGEPVDDISTNGAKHITNGDFNQEIQESGGFTYIATAAVGTALASAAWKARRIDSTGTTLYADGDANFDNIATDLTALSYSYS